MSQLPITKATARIYWRIEVCPRSLQGRARVSDASTAIRPFEERDEADVVAVWHRSGLAAYPYLPTWQAFTLERAGEVFKAMIRPRCHIWVGTRHDRVVAYLAMAGSCID